MRISAEKALAYLGTIANKEEIPQIIFLDINMPGLNGFEFLEQFEKLGITHCKCSVYMLTSSQNDRDIERAKTFKHVSSYLVKPLNKTVLQKVCVSTK